MKAQTAPMSETVCFNPTQEPVTPVIIKSTPGGSGSSNTSVEIKSCSGMEDFSDDTWMLSLARHSGRIINVKVSVDGGLPIDIIITPSLEEQTSVNLFYGTERLILVEQGDSNGDIRMHVKSPDTTFKVTEKEMSKVTYWKESKGLFSENMTSVVVMQGNKQLGDVPVGEFTSEVKVTICYDIIQEVVSSESNSSGQN